MIWTVKTLSELCNIEIGKTPSRNNLEYWNGDLKWLSISDMKNKYITNTKECITEKAVKESNCKLVPANTLLMSFKLSIGKLAFTTEPIYTNEAIASFNIKDQNEILSEYLYYVLQTLDLTRGSEKAVKGLTLNKDKLSKLKIKYPSLAEQQKIVAILDKADEIRSKKKLANDKLDEFLKSTFINMFGDPVENKKQLPQYKLEDLASKEKYAIVDGPFGASLKQYEYVEKGIPVIRINNIRPTGFYNDDFKYITQEKYNSLIRSKVDFNDVLIARVGNTIGKSCIFNMNFEALLSTTGVCKITCDKDKILPQFLTKQFNMPSFQKYIMKNVSGSGQPYFNLSTIKQFMILTPSIECQKVFVNILEHIEQQKEKNQRIIEQMNNLFNSLSQKAFKGEL